MSRIEKIENALMEMAGTTFQKLCDLYVHYKYEREIQSFSATGSQQGKNQSIKGTPDSYFFIEDGYAFIESTTQQNNLIPKIKRDIKKCLDVSKTKIPLNQINRIIVFYTQRLGLEKENEIRLCFQQYPVKLCLFDIDYLKNELSYEFGYIAKEFLGIQMDWQQLVPMDYFVDNYNVKLKKFATPINNPFLYREQELVNIKKIIEKEDIIIIRGDSGVGKTKLAIESILQFKSEHSNFKVYCLDSYKSITDDLFDKGNRYKNLILFIDDVNKSKHELAKILSTVFRKVEINLKIVLTVRQYAYKEIADFLLSEHISYKEIYINAFTQEEVSGIISSAPFNIDNPLWINRIIQISKGNARLAIMGAKVLVDNPEMDLFKDVYILYDHYFHKMLYELKDIEEVQLVKVLGCISAFYTIDLKDKSFLENLCSFLEMDETKLRDIINELESKELLEVRYERPKINEQTTATYFFYKLFIADKKLSLEKFLKLFYQDHAYHITYEINSITDIFGSSEFVKNELKKYYKDNLSNSNLKKILLSHFWMYLGKELFEYSYQQIKSIEREIEDVYIYNKESQNFWNEDFYYTYLKCYIDSRKEISKDDFSTVINLLLEYIRRKPLSFSDLIRYIQNQGISNKRLGQILEHLISNNYDKLCNCLFFELVHLFIDRMDHIKYPELRMSIWNKIIETYSVDESQVTTILYKYLLRSNYSVDTYINDLKYLKPFIESQLDIENFRILYLFNRAFDEFEDDGLNLSFISEFRNRCISEEYMLLLDLDWNRLNGDKEASYDLKFEIYNKKKETELNVKFQIQKLSDFNPILKSLENSFLIYPEHLNIEHSIRCIIANTLNTNFDLGIELIEALFSNHPNFEPYFFMFNNLDTIDKIDRIWLILDTYEVKINLKINFFFALPEFASNELYYEKYIATINQIKVNQIYEFHLESCTVFKAYKREIYQEVLQIIIDKNRDEKCNIRLRGNDILSCIEYIPVDLLQEAYLQQSLIDNHFDSKLKLFEALFNKNPKFLISYIFNNDILELKDRHYSGSFSFIWSYENIQDLMIQIYNYFVSEYELSIDDIIKRKKGRASREILFHLLEKLSEEHIIVAKTVLYKWIEKKHLNTVAMNILFKVIRHQNSIHLEDILLVYLKYNKNVDDFKNLSLVSSFAMTSGYGTFGDIWADKWMHILQIIRRFPDQFSIFEIRQYLESKIENYKEYAEEEHEKNYANYRS